MSRGFFFFFYAPSVVGRLSSSVNFKQCTDPIFTADLAWLPQKSQEKWRLRRKQKKHYPSLIARVKTNLYPMVGPGRTVFLRDSLICETKCCINVTNISCLSSWFISSFSASCRYTTNKISCKQHFFSRKINICGRAFLIAFTATATKTYHF